mmetsp:Transcript_22630/g.55923  ORF Transcript_22630/g.55923 Transcript_22630/m.55923 type:complete len:81 (+) Transcript_22630:199-441(+)
MPKARGDSHSPCKTVHDGVRGAKSIVLSVEPPDPGGPLSKRDPVQYPIKHVFIANGKKYTSNLFVSSFGFFFSAHRFASH